MPSGSLEENAGELDAFLCTIDPTLSSNYQCTQFGSVGNDFASSCAVVSNSAYLLGTAESGPVNGFGEKWFGGKGERFYATSALVCTVLSFKN